ncbi:hypothetical protein MPK64_gp195 [Erwinia phage pEa_SNUABM_16]|uniref:Uncharacterized protein n=1 Tax=Erwinia phage pEa_SNUABM_16 TaxID=2869544 RepID=A0AAE9BUA6_9CAUD|nr:hypothetical protein MPK64_gp195 [Erwinia phage pEa_SNUABM_16]QZE59098.1 hypothetical protein pEaSNUABM18_00195 [Erwinia phage pEa_SNUABM_18]UAW96339.1 hypothetical protein pEaSNUABM16_00195 [Erwinia phage pEa_SNUABM_16]
MQYLSSFAPLNEAVHPAVLFFDDHDDLPEFTLDTIDDTLRQARTVLGTANQLNPVRGRLGENYFLTFLKYAKNGTGAYADAPTITTASRNVGTIHHHTSNGGDVYRQGPTYYWTNQAQARVSVLNPGGVETLNYPSWQVETSMGRSIYVSYLLSDGQTLTGKSWSTTYVSRYNTISPAFAGITPDVRFIDCMTQISSESSNGTNRPYQNSGPTPYTALGENLTQVDEAINLSHAIMAMADNVFMRLTAGVDFVTSENLEPGTRPYIDFPKNHTEL